MGGSEHVKHPVLVYVHGESFEWNSGNPYDGSVLSSYADLVVVTINYRLGILGKISKYDILEGVSLFLFGKGKGRAFFSYGCLRNGFSGLVHIAI